MAGREQRTEQPTPRRLERARREGQFPVSREFVSALAFLAFVGLAVMGAPQALIAARGLFAHLVQIAFSSELSPRMLANLLAWMGWNYFAALLAAGFLLTAITLGLQLATTGFGVSWKKLAPDWSRLSPVSRLRQLPSQNLGLLLQALLLLPLFLCAAYAVVKGSLATLLALPRMPLPSGLASVGAVLKDLLWKAAIVFVLVGSVDLFRQRRRWKEQLRMSKQEVREEQKEVEANPLVRMRIRRLQRELARRRMMAEVPKATAIIVNPTHYAVAIRYQVNVMAAPKVVAKGKNHLALRIRETAVRSQVPVIENPPLAQALYRSAEVGQEIPPHLYQAVAEILAYIYRLMRGNLPGQ